METLLIWVIFGSLMVAETCPLIYIVCFKRHYKLEDLLWSIAGIAITLMVLGVTALHAWRLIDSSLTTC